MELTLIHLYPEQMNIYGDLGNVAALKFRCQQRGISLTVRNIRPADRLTPGSFDLVFGGGGQDNQQVIVSRALQNQKSVLKAAAAQGIPMLTICGTYQLFGRCFKPFAGPVLPGIGIFPASTLASLKRKIGNILIKTDWGELVGFENHSGNTYLENKHQAFGRVIAGFGNNGRDHTEGCRINNIFGCYLHGSLLPKNPVLADHLITTALEIKYQTKIKLQPLDDRLEWRAHDEAVKIANKKSGWRNR